MLPRSLRTTVPSCLALLVVLASCTRSGPGATSKVGATDQTAPAVTATQLLGDDRGVTTVTATFSEPLDPATVNSSTLVVTGPNALPVRGRVSYDAENRQAQFTPDDPFVQGTEYSASLSRSIHDVAGNQLAAAHLWLFTEQATAARLARPALGHADGFAVLAGSTVTSTGQTSLNGDLGVSPGRAVTGFPPGTMKGAIHAGDDASARGMSDLTTAYNDAKGRKLGAVSIAGNQGGKTLPPGLYRSTSSLAISSGDLTLDAQGDPNAVFIFQIASSLTTTSGRAVVLKGGARAQNVFWQVGSSATLGTDSVFKGTIMADQSISLNTGATLNGRALARVGAVTLAANAIVSP